MEFKFKPYLKIKVSCQMCSVYEQQLLSSRYRDKHTEETLVKKIGD